MNVIAGMKLLCIGAVAALLLVWSGKASADSSGTCGQSLQIPLHTRGELTIESRAAGIEVVGTDEDILRISCTVAPVSAANQIEIKYSGSEESGKVTIRGGPLSTDNLQIRVEVPHRTDLRIHAPAGQVSVHRVAGNKDIHLYAGQIVVNSGVPEDYRYVEASVTVGEVKASAYGVDKGGFFRSFSRKISGGEYRLRAHVLTGQIDLE